MSRIGRLPVAIPAGVEVTVAAGKDVYKRQIYNVKIFEICRTFCNHMYDRNSAGAGAAAVFWGHHSDR